MSSFMEEESTGAFTQPPIQLLTRHADSSPGRAKRAGLLLSLLTIALVLRLHRVDLAPLSLDEAESSVNALTILQSGLPLDTYLDQPIYENALTIPWPGNPEYEFRDSSYGPPVYGTHGLALYHGWLPLYAIAASFRLFGIIPDIPGLRVPRYSVSERRSRTIAARLPGVLFGVLSIAGLYLAGSRLHSRNAGWIATLFGTFLFVHVNFSRQARYYGATLAGIALCMWSMERMAQSRRWRDFVIGALVFCFLFYTHILSFLVATIVLVISQVYRWHRSVVPKLAVFFAIVGVFTIPWMLITGLPQQMSGIPPAWKLMSFPRDLIVVHLVKSEYGLVALAGLALLAISRFARPSVLARRALATFLPHIRAFALLYVWLLIAYVAFLFVTPAASFFTKRLGLMLLVPVILLVSMFLCSGGAFILPRRPLVPALIGAAVLLGVFDYIHGLEPTTLGAARETYDIDVVVDYLRKASLSSDTLLFASPTWHLIFEFYTGIPVQSIAPVRKSFLDSYPAPLILFELEDLSPTKAIEPQVLQTASAATSPLTFNQARDLSCEIASSVYRERLSAQVANVFPAPSPIPPFAAKAARDHFLQVQERDHMLDVILHATTRIFRNATIHTYSDFGNRFYYAFVNPDWRAQHPNYRDRMRNATATVLDCSDVVALHSSRPGGS
jgi:hypothetical protein